MKHLWKTALLDRVKEIEQCTKCQAYRVHIWLDDDMDVFMLPLHTTGDCLVSQPPQPEPQLPQPSRESNPTAYEEAVSSLVEAILDSPDAIRTHQ